MAPGSPMGSCSVSQLLTCPAWDALPQGLLAPPSSLRHSGLHLILNSDHTANEKDGPESGTAPPQPSSTINAHPAWESLNTWGRGHSRANNLQAASGFHQECGGKGVVTRQLSITVKTRPPAHPGAVPHPWHHSHTRKRRWNP